MPLFQLGLIPIPIDLDLNTLNISSESFIQTIEKNKLKGLFLTNILGFSCNIDLIKDICD